MNRREDSIAAANVLTAAYDEPVRHKVYLNDDTLRDGEQTVGVQFSLEQKVEIARRILDAGVHHLCIGFPAVSEEERRAARAVLALGYPDRTLYALARAVTGDIDAVLACGCNFVVTFVPISDIHLKYKLRCDEDTALEKTAAAVKYARSKGLEVAVGFEDASRAPLSRIIRFGKEMLSAGAKYVTISDTVGIFTPLSTYRIVREFLAEVSVQLGVHFHNDLGMAVANSVAAVQAGATTVCGSFAGLGERAGNTCLEEAATILRVKYGSMQDVDLTKLANAARFIAETAHLPVAPCKPIIGGNVFSHESGIHVHGVTSESSTYEAFPPDLVGRAHEIHFGKHSGLHSMRYVAEKYAITASDAAMEETLRLIKSRSSDSGSPSPDEVASMLRDVAAATA